VALSAAECLCHQVVCVGFGERFAPHQEAVAQRRGDGVDDKLWVDIGWYPDNVQIQLAAQTIAVSAEQQRPRAGVAPHHQHRKTLRGLRAENRS